MQKEMPKHMANGFSVQGREQIHINGVDDVERFDESCVLLSTNLGRLRIDGQGLQVKKLDVDLGQVVVLGRIDAAVYEEKKELKSFWEKLFS